MNKNLPVVILCGGFGSRLGVEGKKTPKALIKIGGKPIIFHLIEFFKKNSFSNIFLATGYKHKSIKEYIKKNKYLNKVNVINTGLKTMTGGRLLKLKKHLEEYDRFLVTYGDGLSNINIKKLLKFHKMHKRLATVTAVQPFTNFGELFFYNNIRIKKMSEKEHLNNRWINGGFFIFEKKIFNFIKRFDEALEKEPLNRIIRRKQLFAYKHKKFWKC